MKTRVAETSINTYHEIQADGTELSQCDRIMKFMNERKIATRREIANALLIENGACAGRCNKLVDEKKLEKGVKIKCSITGRKVGTVMVPIGQK